MDARPGLQCMLVADRVHDEVHQIGCITHRRIAVIGRSGESDGRPRLYLYFVCFPMSLLQADPLGLNRSAHGTVTTCAVLTAPVAVSCRGVDVSSAITSELARQLTDRQTTSNDLERHVSAEDGPTGAARGGGRAGHGERGARRLFVARPAAAGRAAHGRGGHDPGAVLRHCAV